MTKLINENGEKVIQLDDITTVIEKYYKTLYESKIRPPPEKEENDRIIVKNVGSEDIPEITADETENSDKYAK